MTNQPTITRIDLEDSRCQAALDVARQATRTHSNAKLHEMTVGHLPFLDRPEETGRVIRGFLEEESQNGASNDLSHSEPSLSIQES